MAKRKFYYVTILALLATTTFASFIKKKSENIDEKVTEFEMELTEHGTNFTQKMTLDDKNGLFIVETPSHNGRVGTKFIYDTTNGLMLEVCDEAETAEFHRSFVAINLEHQKNNVKSWIEDNDVSDDRFELQASPENTFKLININGPNVDIECVPEKYRGFIPKGYRIYLAHQVRPLPGNVHHRGNESLFTIIDPMSQRKYNYDDDYLEVIKDVFDDILPPCAFKQSKRVKRQEHNCVDAQMRIVPRCTTRVLNCARGCDTEYTGWDCTNIRDKCHYLLVCPHDQSYVNRACISHIQHADSACRPCCRVRGCKDFATIAGDSFQTCQYMPDDDICPAPGAGCKLENVETRYMLGRDRKSCSIDDVCDSVMDSSGSVANSGINCLTGVRARRKKQFCCNTREKRGANLKYCAELDAEAN